MSAKPSRIARLPAPTARPLFSPFIRGAFLSMCRAPPPAIGQRHSLACAAHSAHANKTAHVKRSVCASSAIAASSVAQRCAGKGTLNRARRIERSQAPLFI